MSDMSIFDHKTISAALKDAFNKIKNTKSHIKMAVSGKEEPYDFAGSVSAKFYSNGLSVELSGLFLIGPYTSILYIEVEG